MSISLDTPILEFPRYGIARLSAPMSGKLAAALAQVSEKTDPSEITVEDLLNYFPARYEDRSNFLTIDRLEDGLEAAVEIFVKVSGGFQVGKNRHPRQPPLFIFEISGSDARNRLKPVVVKWFVSGRQAKHALKYYEERFSRGTRFVAFGKWEWDKRLQTFALMVNKPEELEILPGTAEHIPDAADRTEAEQLASDEGDPSLATVHTARRVPVYRKLGDFQTKRLREIVYSTLQALDPDTVSDHLPQELREREELIARGQALREIHFPPDTAMISEYEMFRSPAHKRLIFDEFFWLSFSMQLLRGLCDLSAERAREYKRIEERP